MEEAIELCRSKDTKVRMAGVERLHQLLESSRKPLSSSSEVTSVVDTCLDLLKDNNFRVSQGGLLALASAAVVSGDLLKIHLNSVVPAAVDRLGDSKQPVRDAARRLLVTLMQVSSPTIIVERAGSYAWEHKSWRVREEFARTVTSAINLSASTELPLQRAILPPILHMLNDPNVSVRDAAISCIEDEQRNQLTSIEAQLEAIKENYTSEYAQSMKYIHANCEMDKKRDMHYQRKIAVDLDNHLTAFRRLHAQQSQIEEKRIKDDAAVEEAKRKEMVLHEENLRQQKAKAEEEARREIARRVEELKIKEEEERAKEAAQKLAKEKSAAAALTTQNVSSTTPSTNVPREVQSTGNLIRAAENALKLEEKRLQIYKEFEQRNQSILSGFNMDLRPKEREIARLIKQISGSQDSVRSKAGELLKIFNDPALPQSVTVAMFAKKVVSIFETPNANFNTSAFACGHVIVIVSGQVPAVMNLLLAELHKVCTYTVPKHVVNSKAAFQTKERYCKTIGFREEDGNLESMDQYLGSYMKLYGALVQTEVQNVHNMHGLEEGWTWLAWFLNALPATLLTAVALEAFLRMAGFALYRKYKDQFKKILSAISHEFVHKLKDSGKPEINSVITRLEDYINSEKFLEEPQGWRLRDTLLSHNADFDSQNDCRQQY